MKFGARQLALSAIAAGVLAASQGTFAHDSIRYTANEGVGGDNAVVVGHGCHVADTEHDVLAQNVLWPAGSTISTANSGTVAPTGAGATPAATLGDVIDLADFVNQFQLIQSKDIFAEQDEINVSPETDSTIGFMGSNGRLSHNLHGETPFRYPAVTFAAATCYNKVVVHATVDDICDGGNHNLWVKTSDTVSAENPINNNDAGNLEELGSSVKLTFKRDLTTNPYKKHKLNRKGEAVLDREGNPKLFPNKACGDGLTAELLPTVAEVNAKLPPVPNLPAPAQ